MIQDEQYKQFSILKYTASKPEGEIYLYFSV